jgi:hypothetical protein
MWLAALHRRGAKADPRAMTAPSAHVSSTARPPLPAHRTQRLELVLRELRKRARHHPAPHLIREAIDGLEAELAAARRQLARH